MNAQPSHRLLPALLATALVVAMTSQSAAFTVAPAMPLPSLRADSSSPAPPAPTGAPWLPDWSDVPADQQAALLALFSELAGDPSGTLSPAFPAVYDALAPTIRAIHGHWSAEQDHELQAAVGEAVEAALPFATAYFNGEDAPEPAQVQNGTSVMGLTCTRQYYGPTQSPLMFAWGVVCLVVQLAFVSTISDYGCYWYRQLTGDPYGYYPCPMEEVVDDAVPNTGPLLPGGIGGGGGGGGGPSRPNPPSGGGSPAPSTQQDSDGDGVGDEFAQTWAERIGQAIKSPDDLDGDQLNNLGEFRWGLVPACFPAFENCADNERNPMTGAGGDGWQDGPEVRYWNDEANDAALVIHLDNVDGPVLPRPRFHPRHGRRQQAQRQGHGLRRRLPQRRCRVLRLRHLPGAAGQRLRAE